MNKKEKEQREKDFQGNTISNDFDELVFKNPDLFHNDNEEDDDKVAQQFLTYMKNKCKKDPDLTQAFEVFQKLLNKKEENENDKHIFSTEELANAKEILSKQVYSIICLRNKLEDCCISMHMQLQRDRYHLEYADVDTWQNDPTVTVEVIRNDILPNMWEYVEYLQAQINHIINTVKTEIDVRP